MEGALNLKRKPLSEKTKIKISESNKGKAGHILTSYQKMKISKALKGKKRTEDVKRKIRISFIKYVEEHKGKFYANIGKSEKEILDNEECLNNCKILRQFHIKELGYFPDGYCEDKNIVYEIYEPFHRKRIEKDFIRRINIQNFLNCDFIIIWSDTKEKEIWKKENII